MVVLDIPSFAGLSDLAGQHGFSRLFRGLPSSPPHAPSRTAHYLSAMHFRHLAVC